MIPGINQNKMCFHFSIELIQVAFLATAVHHIRPMKYMSLGESNPEINICFLFLYNGVCFVICSFILEIRIWGVNGQDSARYTALY